MRAIKDAGGNDVSYIPVQLKSGQLSAAIPLTITAEAGDKLKATVSPDAQVMGRLAGAGAYADLGVAPLALGAGDTPVEIKIQAGAGAGLRRVSLSLSLPEASAAGWTA
jgi:hypothetical protein